MDKQELIKRIDALTFQLTQIRAAYSKVEGHIEEAKHWLSTIDELKKDAKEKKKVAPIKSKTNKE